MTLLRNATLLLCATMTIMAGATIAPALPQMQLAFSSMPNSELLVKLALTIPALLIAITAIKLGSFADRYGRKPVLVASLLLYGIASTSGYWLSSLEWILVGRGLLGIAVAGIMTSTTALVADYFKGAALNKFMGIQTSVIGIGGFIFLSAGGWLAAINWRLPFVLYVFSVAIIPLALMFLTGNQSEAKSSAIKTQPEHSQFHYNWVGLAIAFISMTAFYMLPTQLPFLLSQFSTLNPSGIGLIIASMTLATSGASLLYGKLKSQFSFTIIFAFVFAFLSIGMWLIGTAETYHLAIVGVVLCGTGVGWLMPNLNVWFVSESTPQHRGKHIGVLTTALFLGQFASPILLAPVIARIDLADTFVLVGQGLFLLAMLFVLASYQQYRRVAEVN